MQKKSRPTNKSLTAQGVAPNVLVGRKAGIIFKQPMDSLFFLNHFWRWPFCRNIFFHVHTSFRQRSFLGNASSSSPPPGLYTENDMLRRAAAALFKVSVLAAFFPDDDDDDDNDDDGLKFRSR
jgi:hypothetical protein